MLTEKLRRMLIKDISALGGLPFFLFLSVLLQLMSSTSLGMQLFAGIIISYIVVVPFRQFVFRNRPNSETHSNWLERLDASSFPSLHSYRAAMLATLVALTLAPGWDLFVAVYLVAFLTIYALAVMGTRYVLKKHYLSDIVVGAVLGIITAWALHFFL